MDKMKAMKIANIALTVIGAIASVGTTILDGKVEEAELTKKVEEVLKSKGIE